MAAVWYNKTDIRALEVGHSPLPDKGEVAVKVLWVGICGYGPYEYIAGPIFILSFEPHSPIEDQDPVVFSYLILLSFSLNGKFKKMVTCKREILSPCRINERLPPLN
jgi:hypothetical protein